MKNLLSFLCTLMTTEIREIYHSNQRKRQSISIDEIYRHTPLSIRLMPVKFRILHYNPEHVYFTLQIGSELSENSDELDGQPSMWIYSTLNLHIHPQTLDIFPKTKEKSKISMEIRYDVVDFSGVWPWIKDLPSVVCVSDEYYKHLIGETYEDPDMRPIILYITSNYRSRIIGYFGSDPVYMFSNNNVSVRKTYIPTLKKLCDTEDHLYDFIVRNRNRKAMFIILSKTIWIHDILRDILLEPVSRNLKFIKHFSHDK